MLAGNAMPGVPNRMFDIIPRRSGAATAFEALPAGLQIGLDVIPLTAQVVLSGFKPVLICWAEVVVVAAGSVRSRAKVAPPPAVLVVPGSIRRHLGLPGFGSCTPKDPYSIPGFPHAA